MHESTTIALGADDVLDFNDIVLITMSSSATTGRVMAASICSCGTIFPAPTPAVDAERCAPIDPLPTGGRHIVRRVYAALKRLRPA